MQAYEVCCIIITKNNVCIIFCTNPQMHYSDSLTNAQCRVPLTSYTCTADNATKITAKLKHLKFRIARNFSIGAQNQLILDIPQTNTWTISQIHLLIYNSNQRQSCTTLSYTVQQVILYNIQLGLGLIKMCLFIA